MVITDLHYKINTPWFSNKSIILQVLTADDDGTNEGEDFYELNEAGTLTVSDDDDYINEDDRETFESTIYSWMGNALALSTDESTPSREAVQAIYNKVEQKVSEGSS